MARSFRVPDSCEALSEHMRAVEKTDAWAEFLGQAEWAEFLESTGPRSDAAEKSVIDVEPGGRVPARRRLNAP